MLISDTHQFIFIHIPKTAGSSIRFALTPYSLDKPGTALSKVLKRVSLPRDYRRFRFNLHSSLQDVQLRMPPETFGQYKKIAFVRNPWDRMVSSYAYKVHGTSVKVRRRDDSFKAFIYSELERKKRQQVDYIRGVDGELNCDFMGRFESLVPDYEKLENLLAVSLPVLPVLNKSKGRGAYRDLYNDETKKLVSDYFEEDIDLLRYTF